jgi:hypothetical protein
LIAAIMTVAAALILLNGASYGTTYRDRLDFGTTLVQSFAAQVLPRLQPDSLVIPAAALALIGLLLVFVRAFEPRRNVYMLMLWGICLFSLIAIAAFCAITGKFSSRYPAIVAPLALTSIGAALSFSRDTSPAMKAALGAIAGLATTIFAFGLVQAHTNPIYVNEDFRGAAAFIRANKQHDEGVVLVSGHFAPVFEYYWAKDDGRWTIGDQDWLALPDDPVLNVNNTLTFTSTAPAMNAALAGRGGAWLLLWQDEVIDPTGLAPALLRRQSQNLGPQLDTTEFTGLRVQHYRFFQPYESLPEFLPQMQSQFEANSAQRGLGGLGCYQPHMPRAGDGWMEVQCFWQVKPFVPLSVYTKVSLRLFDKNGMQVLQSDQPIAPNGMPYVPFEKPILGLYFIELPKDLPADDYTLRVIPYTETEEIAPQVVTPVRILPR